MKELCFPSLLAVSGDTMSDVSEKEKETNPPATEAAPPCPTVTQRDQWMVESQVFQIYHLFATIPPNAQTLMYVIHFNACSIFFILLFEFLLLKSFFFFSLQVGAATRESHAVYLQRTSSPQFRVFCIGLKVTLCVCVLLLLFKSQFLLLCSD